jgi:uncharacterized membrane protein YidH (DUF202 family)
VVVVSALYKSQFTPAERWIISAFILGPSAWMLHLFVSYSLEPESCDRGTKLILHVVTIVCVALALVAAAIAWRVRTSSSGERMEWLTTVTLILSLSMVVVILAQEIPNVLLRSCQ